MQTTSQKGLQRPFWYSLRYVAALSRSRATLQPFLQLLWLILWALALVPGKTLKNAKNDVFSTFAPKIGLFSLKTAAKAHTELQYGRTNVTKWFPIKKYAIEKFFHTTLQNVDFSGLRGGTFAVFFLNIQTSQRKTVCTVGNVSTCSTFPPNPILLWAL